MYLGSDEFNNAIENTSGNAPKIRVTLEDGTTLDNIKSIKYYGGSNDSDDVSIGTTNMARIDVTAFTDKMLTNNEIFLEQGIELADGVVEYMPIGYFTIQKPSGDIDEVSFTAYDRMQKFEKPYSSSLAYPTTSALILDELCQICGIELATTLGNAIEVMENLKGYTCREVLGYIASMHGYFACIDRYGKLNLRWYSDTPIEKSLKKIWHFEKSQDNFEIAKVEIAKDSETKYESGNGITTLHNSNPLATQEIVDNIFAKLGGFSYSVGEIEMLDDARLDPWDMVSVEYYDGKTYNIPCMTLEHDFKAYSTTVKSVGKSESENEYRFTGPTIQYLNRMATELLVANRVIATKVDADYVNSVAITTENFDAKVAEIKELIVEEIDGKYANIDLANVEVANIGEFFARSGILENVLIDNGAVTGTLKGVRIVGDVIEANTIKADSLILSGSEDSLIYQINVNASGLTAEQLSDEIYKQKLSGTDLVAQSVTTNELVAGCITTEKIQAGAITTTEIASNTITGNNLASNTITSREINVDELFAQNITASGTITGATLKGTDAEITKGKIGAFTLTDKLAATVNAYVAPSSTERDKVKDYIYNSGNLTSTELSASDLNKDGRVTIKDLLLITKILCGDASYSAQAGAKQTSVSMEINPTNAEKLIRLTGTNAWGRSIEQYFGINGLKTDNVIAKSVVANSIETTSGANLDTINSNLNTVKTVLNENSVLVKQCGKHVEVSVYNATQRTLKANQRNTLATIPTGSRPSYNVRFALDDNTASKHANNTVITGRVLTDGQVQVWVFDDKTSIAPCGSCSFFT